MHAPCRDRALAEAILIDNLERYSAIEEITGEPSANGFFERFHFDSVATEEQIDSAADVLRGEWDLGLDPVPSLCALLEDKGILVVEDDLPERINGLACRVQRVARPVADAVIVSNRTNVERKRFTLAHELAHRIIRSTGNPAIRLEKAMDRFAGAFLVPKRHLLSEVGPDRHRVTYHEIIHLKHTYGVSASAMLLRLGQAGVCSNPGYDMPSGPSPARGGRRNLNRLAVTRDSRHLRNRGASRVSSGVLLAKG